MVEINIMNKINISYFSNLFICQFQVNYQTQFIVTISRPYISVKCKNNHIVFNIIIIMSLNYVTQVIYIQKLNINRPSPEDETVSHPN